MNVPLLDLKAQYQSLRSEIRAAIDEVCDSQYFIMGPVVERFELQIAEYCQAKHAIGVSSGTDALLIALMALGIESGDEVITTPYSFFATAGSIRRTGAKPLFVDIDTDSFNISVTKLRRAIEESCDFTDGTLRNKKTNGIVRAIMPVHLFGQVAQMQEIEALAEEYSLKLIEDAAQAIGSEDASRRRAGSMSDIACFSFFPSKNLGAFGDAGLCTTNDDELADKLRILRVHGGRPKYYHRVVGGNFRLDAIQAAVLDVKLKHLDSWTDRRQQNADYYDKAFESAGLSTIRTPFRGDGKRHIFNQYVIRVPGRDELRQHLSDNSIGTEVYYPVPLHMQDCFSDLGYVAGDFPEAEAAASTSIALPVYPELTQVQLDYVVRHIKDFLR